MLFVLFLCWNILSCWHCAEWSSQTWVSALVSFVFSHRCHSLSLCIVNGLCRCAVLVLPASRFCWCPLIISLLMEMAFISTPLLNLTVLSSGHPPWLQPVKPSCPSGRDTHVCWAPTLYSLWASFVYSSSSLMHWRLSNRLLLHIRFFIKSGAGGWGVVLGQLCVREKQVIGCCLLWMCMVPRWCFGRLICSISVRCHHLFTLTACVRKIKHGTWKTDICCCSKCMLEVSEHCPDSPCEMTCDRSLPFLHFQLDVY